MVSLIDMITLAITLNIAYKYNKNPSFYKYFDINLAKRLLKDSWPLILSSVAVMIYMRIDQVMIKNMLGDKEVGLYSAAVKLVEVWHFIPMIVAQSLFPAIVSVYDNKNEFYNRLMKLSCLLGYLGLALSLSLSIFSSFIVFKLYGSKYLGSESILSIAAFSIFFSFWMSGVSRRQAIDLQIVALLATIFSAICNVVFNLLFIPQFGAKGAALGTVLSQFMAGPFFGFLHPKSRENVLIAVKGLVLPFKGFKS